ncbi:MAG: 50S ribosomal protein L20 [Candidatus Pacebacteria bacterium]|jgi:large subunit ribosomal protein L20|nr:50S ribosomal protein L20 [Candidatus Paceibacterota bacterium]NCN87594.1 50S ribosomal protein L20 [Candidatus Paceibacterota bacterium]
MPRVKSGYTRHRRHKKVLSLTKGFRGTNNRLYKRAKEALLHAGQYAFIGRKLRKRDFRRLWITRINAGLKSMEAKLSYSRLIKALKDNQVELNRKMLADLAVSDFNAFRKVIEKVQG